VIGVSLYFRSRLYVFYAAPAEILNLRDLKIHYKANVVEYFVRRLQHSSSLLLSALTVASFVVPGSR